jgi:hypothetical protein
MLSSKKILREDLYLPCRAMPAWLESRFTVKQKSSTGSFLQNGNAWEDFPGESSQLLLNKLARD